MSECEVIVGVDIICVDAADAMLGGEGYSALRIARREFNHALDIHTRAR